MMTHASLGHPRLTSNQCHRAATTGDGPFALCSGQAACNLRRDPTGGGCEDAHDPAAHRPCAWKVAKRLRDVGMPTGHKLTQKSMVIGCMHALELVLAAEFVIDRNHGGSPDLD